MTRLSLGQAIRSALQQQYLTAAAVAVPALLSAQLAQAQTADNTADQKSQSLETIVVTGSNIRRVDIETANPVVTIDRAAIQQSGRLTLGDLVQDLPAVTGPVTNPRVNNGGGTGFSSISLRGLGSVRTLILVDGHRYLYGDVNAIPANAIERIEVLTAGASSVYGSDAVAGVVNFILRTNYQGAEFSADYGISDRDDGERKGYHFIFGQTTDKGSIMAGVDYNKFDSVLSSNRDFSKNAVYFYYGTAHVSGGSSRTPTGYIQLPTNLKSQFGGCSTVTLKSLGSTSNPKPTFNDFRCYSSATDNYNFQAHGNVDLTPQERTNAFVVGTYKLTNEVETYLELFHNKTQSATSLAAQPIDTNGSPLLVSAQSYYNPFGVDFSNTANRFKTRSVGNGNRIGNFSTQVDQVTAGFKGTFGDTSWQWNAYFNYGHSAQLNHTSGYINLKKVNTGLGPSFLDAATGQVVCGTPGNIIAGCTPINIFNITDPATVAALDNASGNTFTNVFFVERSGVAEVNGNVIDLPAGAMQLAAGVSYRKQYSQTIADAIEVPDAAGVCDIGTGCVSPISGGYNVKEAYAELLIPILKDVPFANALNLTIGDRYSKYSNFGSTNNTKFALEWRPIEDLLLRGTVAKVFRAPTITDLFQGSTSDAPQAIDPCFGLVGSNAACQHVPGDGSFKRLPGQTTQINGVQEGAALAGVSLGPEQGKSFDYGFVYDPHFVPGLSLSVDLWRVYLDNQISRVTAQNVLNLCFLANGGPFCGLIHRTPSGLSQGQIDFVQEPKGNLGRLDAKGVDLAARYRLPETAIGNFAFNFQTTYLDRFADDPTPGLPGDFTQEYAGHYATGASAIPYANYSRWKALATINWNLGPFSAAWSMKYIGKFTVGYANLNYNESACQSNAPAGCELKYGATVYHNLTAGYNIEPLNTRIDVGIDNLSDKQPALLYQNNVLNGNVDPNTFDTIGRFYWARVTIKF